MALNSLFCADVP